MRRIASRSGRYNIPNIGIFLWRVASLRLARSPLVGADGSGLGFRFDQLGTDKPSSQQRTEQEITHLAEPLDVPLPLKRRFVEGAPRRPLRRRPIAAARDRTAAASTRFPPPTSASATSPTTRPFPAHGRTSRSPPTRTSRSIRCSAASHFRPRRSAASQRLATFHYGSALAVGGGGYDRAKSLEKLHTIVPVSGGDPLAAALASVAGGGGVQILDSGRYAAPATITATTPAANAAGSRRRRCAPSNRARPLLVRTRPASARDGSGHDGRPERTRARRRAARDRGVGRRRAAQRSCSATARSCPGSRATPTARRTRSAARA